MHSSLTNKAHGKHFHPLQTITWFYSGTQILYFTTNSCDKPQFLDMVNTFIRQRRWRLTSNHCPKGSVFFF